MLEGATRIKEDPCLILGRFSSHLISVFVLRPLFCGGLCLEADFTAWKGSLMIASNNSLGDPMNGVGAVGV